MTTATAESMYLAKHLYETDGKGYVVFNPEGKPPNELPTIYGFNNGGSRYFLDAVLLAEDGVCLGGHVCSDEGYMRHDLGILEGSRPDRHEVFRKHYPGGYKMDFVSRDDVSMHKGLNEAFKKNQELRDAEGSTNE